MLTEDQAKAAADAVIAPKAAEAASLARKRRPPEPGVFRRATSRALGRWTGVISIGGFTAGLLAATFLETHALAGAGFGAAAGALVGLYFDRRYTFETLVLVLIATVVVVYSVLAMAGAP